MALEQAVILVSENYMKQYTFINGSVDPNIFKPCAILAQDEHIQQVIGTDLFNKILNDIRNNTLSGNYLTLVDSYMLKAVAWWTMYELLPHLYMKTDNGSIVVRTSDDSTPISSQDLQNYRDQVREKAQFYTQRMIDYLCFNSGLFPELNTNTLQQLSSNPKANRSTIFEIGSRTGTISPELARIISNNPNNIV